LHGKRGYKMGIEIKKVKNGYIVKASVGEYRDTISARWVCEGDDAKKIGDTVKIARHWEKQTRIAINGQTKTD